MSTIYPGSQLPTDGVSWVSEKRPETRTRPPSKMHSEFRTQVLKLLYLMLFAVLSVLYIHRFNLSFGAYEQLANRVEESGAASDNIDLNAVRFVLQVLVDYKEHVWKMAFAMFVLIITSALLLIQLKYGKSQNQARIMMFLVDVITLVVLFYLFTARLCIAKILKLHLEEALESANRLTDTNEFNNELNCSIVPRENLPSCARSILSDIGPDRAQGCLISLCLLTGSYILSMFLILYNLSSPTLRDRSATDDIHTQHTLSFVYEP